MRTQRHFAGPLAVTAMATALALSGCSGTAVNGNDGEPTGAAEDAEQVDQPQTRLVTTYDGGLLTLDANTLEVIDDTLLEGFNRVNPVGDGRHVMVSVANGFRLFDAGVWTEEHGDHTHSFAGSPELTDTVFEADTPGHVVHHAGSTVLFGDGDGRMQIFDTGAFANGAADPEITEAEEPHHGVAVKLKSGEVLHTIGNEEERSGVKVIDGQGEEIARNEDCPGVHGEAAAGRETIAFGCEDGILYYGNGDFTKVDSPDSYGRIGNQAGSEESSVVLGDYKVDEDAELERPETVTLTDTDTGEMTLVDLGASYSFRSLARGPQGEALVLDTDGKLNVIDPESGKVTDSHQIIEEWQEPVDWQQRRPTLFVQGQKAYVSEPDGNQLHIVDLDTGEVEKSAELPHATNEITGVTG